jgi:hypothetical protein
MPIATTTVPNVMLVRVGVHDISTGTWTVTRADLADAVAAHRAGVVRDAVVKLGHEQPLGSGAPALGRVRRLRLTDNGDVLVGDLVDVPRAVAAMMPSAWPSRSVEGYSGYEAGGRSYGFVLTAVALLGAELPGIPDLADIDAVGELYGVAASHGRRVVIASAANPTDRARAVAVARARRARRARTHRTTV